MQCSTEIRKKKIAHLIERERFSATLVCAYDRTLVMGKKKKKCFLKWNDFNETAQSVQQYHVFHLNEVVKQDLCLHRLLCSYQSNQNSLIVF